MAEHENFSANKYENANYYWHFHMYLQRKFYAQLSRARKSFITSGPDYTGAHSIYIGDSRLALLCLCVTPLSGSVALKI